MRVGRQGSQTNPKNYLRAINFDFLLSGVKELLLVEMSNSFDSVAMGS